MLVIIGCGNPNRLDDGAGVYVAQELIKLLNESPVPDVRVFDAGTSGMDIMFQARGCDALIIIDANQSDSDPGTVFEVPGSELENIPMPSYNLHDFRWDNALYAGRQIYKDDFPTNINVFLIEVESLDLGIGLSKPVQQASDRVIELIMAKVKQYNKAT
ncbi:MAG: hydrogenase maturation protease [Piscirickettsiaceae bacterium]|nr:MAG: hydrogenase maturation protease [Piscirickettsiaceae bacterium]